MCQEPVLQRAPGGCGRHKFDLHFRNITLSTLCETFLASKLTGLTSEEQHERYVDEVERLVLASDDEELGEEAFVDAAVLFLGILERAYNGDSEDDPRAAQDDELPRSYDPLRWEMLGSHQAGPRIPFRELGTSKHESNRALLDHLLNIATGETMYLIRGEEGE